MNRTDSLVLGAFDAVSRSTRFLTPVSTTPGLAKAEVDVVRVHHGPLQFGELSATRTALEVEDPSQPRVDIAHYLSGQFAELVIKVGSFDRLQLGHIGHRFLRQPGHAGSD
jgi:hypothetical protein